MLATENRMQLAGVLPALIEWIQHYAMKPLSFIQSPSFDTIVVNTDTPVRVSDRHIDSQIIVKRIIRGGKFELRELSIGSVEFHLVRTEDQKQNYSDYSNGNDDADENLAYTAP